MGKKTGADRTAPRKDEAFLRLPARSVRALYRDLLAHYGPQHWWPGDGHFEIMVGAVLTQNTAWSNVERAITLLKRARALRAKTIAAMPHRRLAELVRPSGYFNVKARRLQSFCRWYVKNGGFARLNRLEDHALRAALLAVHGIGRETADDILLYAFERPVFVIDAYTRRLFARMGWCAGTEDYDALRVAVERVFGAEVPVLNELHALIVRHGKDVCRPRPRCWECPVQRRCRYDSS